MKHIKKKYLLEIPLTKIKPEADLEYIHRNEKQVKSNENKERYFQTTDNTLIKSIFFKGKNGGITVPMPDLVLSYYDFAYHCNKIRKDKEKEMFSKLYSHEESTDGVLHELYHYFGAASSCIINMFSALEAFMNQSIPKSYLYLSNTKDHIQKFEKFDIKLKKIIPDIFFKTYDLEKSHFIRLQKLRDDIIHTKSKEDFSLQEDLMIRILSFKYDECLKEISDYMNFYNSNYIEECDCSNEF